MASFLAKESGSWESGENPLAHGARAEALAKRLQEEMDPGERLRAQFDFGRALLHAGYLKEAQTALLQAFSALYRNKENVEPDSLREAWQRLGLSYLASWKPESAAEASLSGSMIVPNDRNRPAVQASIEVFKTLLEEFPSDLGTMYLLNVAYIALGEFPDGVPEQYRLPIPEGQDSGLPRFASPSANREMSIDGLAGGVVLEDLNGDGHLDLMASTFRLDEPIRAFVNDGAGSFEEYTESLGLMGIGGGSRLTHADYDNDGDQDVFVLRGGAGAFGNHFNSLLRNDGDGRFDDVTIESGLASRNPSLCAAWGDLNQDGWLDLVVGSGPIPTQRNSGETRNEQASPCEVFLSMGDGRFREAAGELGIEIDEAVASVAIADFDDDGLQDLYVSLAQGENKLYRNRKAIDSGDQPVFSEIAAVAGVAKPVESGLAGWMDIDQDGLLDLLVCGYSASRLGGGLLARDAALDWWDLPAEGERIWLYRNLGDGRFHDASETRKLDGVVYAMGGLAGDFDNDGYEDVFLATGALETPVFLPNRFFGNQTGRGFEDLTLSSGLGDLLAGGSLASGDIDGDGDLDLYVIAGGYSEVSAARNRLWINRETGGNWLSVKLVGVSCARDAIGGRIEIRLHSPDGPRSVFGHVSAGWMGSSPFKQHLGLGSSDEVEDLRVRWPGTVDWVSYGKVEANQEIEIHQDHTGLRVIR